MLQIDGAVRGSGLAADAAPRQEKGFDVASRAVCWLSTLGGQATLFQEGSTLPLVWWSWKRAPRPSDHHPRAPLIRRPAGEPDDRGLKNRTRRRSTRWPAQRGSDGHEGDEAATPTAVLVPQNGCVARMAATLGVATCGRASFAVSGDFSPPVAVAYAGTRMLRAAPVLNRAPDEWVR